MSRHSTGGSRGHRIQRIEPGLYRLSWTVDRYCSGSRLRYPRSTQRDTDEAGARRFAKRWGVKLPTIST